MKIAHRTKYELIQMKKIDGSSLIKNPTTMKENANAIKTVPAAIGNQLPLVLRRSARAVCNANAPMVAAITANSRDTERKPSGRGLLPRETTIAPQEPSARP